MGNTIRRQPVTKSIPAAPNYKFLNITNFKGINKTDNPFTAEVNSASDCLNVYVDENNSLTTRPRVNKDFGVVIPGFKQLLHSYNVNDNYVLQVLDVYGAIKLYYLSGKEWFAIDLQTITLVDDVYSVFENEGLIYVVGNGIYTYFDLENMILYDVTTGAYIPNVTIGTVGSTETVTDEPRNILSNKVTKTFYWDFEKNVNSVINNNGYVYENKYLKSFTSLSWDVADSVIYESDVKAFKYDEGYAYQRLQNTVESTHSEVILNITHGDNGMSTIETLTANVDGIERKPGQNVKIQTITAEDISSGWVKNSSADSTFLVVKTTEAIRNMTPGNEIYFRLIRSENNIRFFKTLHDEIVQSKMMTIHNPIKALSPNGDFIVISSVLNDCLAIVNTETLKYTYSGEVLKGSIALRNDGLELLDMTTEVLVLKSFATTGKCTSTQLMKTGDFTKCGGFGELFYVYGNDVVCIPYTSTDNFFGGLVVYDIGTKQKSQFADEQQFKMSSQTPLNYWLSDDKLTLMVRYVNGANNSPDIRVYKINLETSKCDLLKIIKTIPKDIDNDKIFIKNDGSALAYIDTKYSDVYRMNFDDFDSFPYYRLSSQEYELVTYNMTPDLLTTYRFVSRSGFYNYESKIVGDGLRQTLEPGLVLLFNTDYEIKPFQHNRMLRYQNNYWFYGKDNEVVWTANNNPQYIPETNHNELGSDKYPVVDMCLLSFDVAMAFKPSTAFVISTIQVGDKTTYSFVESKSELGVLSPGSTIISPLNEVPVFSNSKGVYGLHQVKNIQSSDRVATLLSEHINDLYTKATDLDKMITTKHKYWVLFILPHESDSDIFVLDERNMQWFRWNIPFNMIGIWEVNNVMTFVDNSCNYYTFKTTDVLSPYNPEVTEYYDEGRQIIPWKWTSQILPMGTINYSKKLVSTTFIMSDTDTLDEYGINYKFKAFRKLSSETSPITISNKLNYVQSITKRTMIHRFKFIQFELSNIEDDLNNNKFKLIGLGLKYVLLEGLN